MLACLSLLATSPICILVRTLCIVRFVSLTPRLWKCNEPRKYTRRNAKIGLGSMNCSIRIPKRSSLTRKSSGINTCSATFNLSCWWGNMYVDGVAGSTRQSLEWCTRVSLSFIIRHEYLAPIPLTRYPVTRTAKYRAVANITWPT